VELLVAAQTDSYYTAPVAQGSTNRLASVQVTPTLSQADVALIVPDPGVFVLPPKGDLRNKYAFSSASTPVLSQEWQAKVLGLSPAALLPFSSFTCFQITGFNRTNDTRSVAGDLIRQRFTWTATAANGLPASNDAFGQSGRTVTWSVNGGGVTSTQTAPVWLFFAPAATNHPNTNDLPKAPGVTARTTNWYYYWSQTAANPPGGPYRDSQYWGANNPGWDGRADWSASLGAWICVIYSPANTSSTVWSGAQGIDFFANVVRHEHQHLVDFRAWWGAANRVSAQDMDGDWIPDAIEPSMSGRVYSAATPYTWPDEFGYGGQFDPADGRIHILDQEDHALRNQDSWTAGSADAADWTQGGHQW
jgi:hypothetical protein